MTLVLSVLAASILGSPHCAAMCGGFVCLYAADRSDWKSHAAYNIGRLVSYLLLGAVAGVAGAAMNVTGALLGLSRTAAIVSGMLLVLWGVTTLLRAAGMRFWQSNREGPSISQRIMAPLLAKMRGKGAITKAATIGVMSALLPCGFLYAFVATAAGTGRVDSALLVMAIFWLGTLPAMSIVGIGLQRLAGPLRARLPLLTAIAVIVIGTLAMIGKLTPHSHIAPSSPSASHTHGHTS